MKDPMRALNRLTSKRVAKLLTAGIPSRHNDGAGLHLVITGPSSAHWEKRYQRAGATRYMGLGSARTFKLAEAREINRKISQQLAGGIDPIDAKRADRAAAKAVKVRSFGEVALDYFKTHAGEWRSAKHRQQWASTVLGTTPSGRVKDDLCRGLRAMPVSAIDTDAVLKVLAPKWHDKPVTMARLRERIEVVLDAATAAKLRTGDNPAAWQLLKHLLAAPTKIAKVEHHPALPYAELPAFMTALREQSGTAARALEFLVLTATRTSEAINATWSEIDMDTMLWVIPGHRVKKAADHRVPLSDAAVALLRALPTEAGNGHVFIGQTAGKSLGGSMALSRVLHKMGHAAVTVHGFRSTFSSWAHEMTGAAPMTIEACLSHKIGNATALAYNRGDQMMKRRRLMALWAKHCVSPVKRTADVVPLRPAAQS
jgi:integrase